MSEQKNIKNYYFEFTPLQVISRRQASFSLYVFTCEASTFKLLDHVIFNTCFLTGQNRDATKQKFLWLVNTTLEWPETVPQSYRQIFRKLIITIKQWKLQFKKCCLLSSRVITWDDKFFISINNSCSTRNNKIFTNIPEKGKLGKV